MQSRDPEFVGARIKEARLERGLRQSAFVGPLVSPGYVSLIEQGKRMPSRKALGHILGVLEISEQELFKQRDIDFSPKSRASVARADLLITQGDLDGAKKLLSSLPHHAFNLSEVQLVNVELVLVEDPAKAFYVLDQQVDKFIANNQWTHVLRNISLSIKALDLSEQTVEAIVYFSRIHRLLLAKSDADSVVVTVVAAELVKRLVVMGDSDGARLVIEESSSYFVSALSVEQRAQFLIEQSSAAFDSAAYEVSIELARVAQRLLLGESHRQIDTARDRALSTIGTIVAELFPGNHRLNTQLQQLISNQLEFSQADQQRRAAASVALAALMVGSQNVLSATRHLESIDSQLQLAIELEFERNLISARVAISGNDIDSARSYLGKCVEFVESARMGAQSQSLAHRLAAIYEEIGDNDLAFAVMRSGQTRVPNFLEAAAAKSDSAPKK